jgi:hypothetical protein
MFKFLLDRIFAPFRATALLVAEHLSAPQSSVSFSHHTSTGFMPSNQPSPREHGTLDHRDDLVKQCADFYEDFMNENPDMPLEEIRKKAPLQGLEGLGFQPERQAFILKQGFLFAVDRKICAEKATDFVPAPAPVSP